MDGTWNVPTTLTFVGCVLYGEFRGANHPLLWSIVFECTNRAGLLAFHEGFKSFGRLFQASLT